MHVGLNLVYLIPGETGGMETYARELIPRLAEVQGLRLTAFLNTETAEAGPGPWSEIPHEVVPVRARNRIEWVRGEQQHLPRMAARAGVTLVHSLASTSPMHGRFRRVTTIHDLHYKLVPEAHLGVLSLGMRVLVPASARRSHRIIAVSQSTAHDLEAHVGVPRAKIDVVAQGVGERRPAKPTPEAPLRARLGLGERPIVLCVAAKRPHKNLLRLIEAHSRIDAGDRPMLVIPGYSTAHEQELEERARALGTLGWLSMPAWVDQADLEGLYAAAAGFVFPSLYEGFGLPVLEAMQRGLPVACADRGSLPEVAGDAALMFDPEDVTAMHDALERLLRDTSLRTRLSARGRQRAALFTWDATAVATAAVYRRVSGLA